MRRVLIYENRKESPRVYDVSTPALEDAAMLDLFRYLDGVWAVYTYEPRDKEYALYENAKAGSIAAVRKLLRAHRTWEYEQWAIHDVQQLAPNGQASGETGK